MSHRLPFAPRNFAVVFAVILSASACTYDSSSLTDLQCEPGEAPAGKECRDGILVTIDRDMNARPDLGAPDMIAPLLDMMPPIEDMNPPPEDMNPPVDMPDPPEDMGEDMPDPPEDMACETDDAEFCQMFAPDAECGVITEVDACGMTRTNVQCGEQLGCAPGFVCSESLECVECMPESPEVLCGNRECGTHDIPSPACNGQVVQVDCGTCDGNGVCNVDAATCCEPLPEGKICEMNSIGCGMATQDNGCGQQVPVDCGGCGADEACANNQCVCEPAECGGAMCGTVTNACGQSIDCGGCDADETCNAGMCECTVTACPANFGCGEIDACGTPISCGTCSGASAANICGGNTCLENIEVLSPTTAYEAFGFSVATDGDTIVVGAPLADTNGNSMGDAHGRIVIYEKDAAGQWPTTPSQEIEGSCAAGDCLFGYDVDVESGRIVVGAPGSNSAIIYERGSTGTWSQVAFLTRPISTNVTSIVFGLSVSLSGDRIAVGDPYEDPNGSNNTNGAVHIFARNAAGIWLPETIDGLPSDHASAFGYSVSLDGTRLAVGQPRYDINGSEAGQVWLYEYDGNSSKWDVMSNTPLQFSSQDGSDYVGFSVALSGNRVVVGAPDFDAMNGADYGAAAVYSSPGTWSEAILSRTSRVEYDAFGYSSAIDGNVLVVGRAGIEADPDLDDSNQGGNTTGARSGADVYKRTSGTWSRQRSLTIDNTTLFAGADVAVSGEDVVVGAPSRSANDADRIYILRQP